MSEFDLPPEQAPPGPLIRFARDQRVAFLIVGAINAVVGFAIFVVCSMSIGRLVDHQFGKIAGSLVSLAIMYVLSVSLAFIMHRRFVFRVRGHLMRDFVRYWGVYLTALSFNAVTLPVLVELGMARIGAQALVVIATPVVSYFGHRYFSFRRGVADAPDETQRR